MAALLGFCFGIEQALALCHTDQLLATQDALLAFRFWQVRDALDEGTLLVQSRERVYVCCADNLRLTLCEYPSKQSTRHEVEHCSLPAVSLSGFQTKQPAHLHMSSAPIVGVGKCDFHKVSCKIHVLCACKRSVKELAADCLFFRQVKP
ncbi:MAG: hypothetical protein HC828_21825 [Blastochloris sp.]|nr:hypothetical protein [Blastochloris sp.]